MNALFLALLIVGQSAVRTEVSSRLHLRPAAFDSAAVSLLQTRAKVIFTPFETERVSSRVALEMRALGFPSLASLGELNRPEALEPVSLLLGEAYVRVHEPLPGLSLTAGRQLVHWGAADAVNPTDNLCAPDYSDPLEWDARRPAWMAHAEYAPSSFFALEAALRPAFEPALSVPGTWFSPRILPDKEELREGLVQQFIAQGVPEQMARTLAAAYDIRVNEELALPQNRIGNFSGGARAKTRFSVLDLSASVLRGYDFLPTSSARTALDTAQKTLDFTLASSFRRKTVIGADLSAAFFDAGLWAEAALNLYSGGEREVSLVAGADYTLAGIYANVQYLRGSFPLAPAQGEAAPARDFILGAVERGFFSDRLLVRLGGVVDLKHGSYGMLPLVRWMPAPGLELDLGGIILGGKDGSAFAPVRDIDEITFGVKYAF